MSGLRNRATPATVRFDEGPDIDVPVTLKPRVCPTLLVLPYPPSANTLYRTIVRGKRAMPIKSAEHRAYFEAVATRVGFLAAPWPKETPLAVTLRLYRPRKSGDIDGPIKALLDSLNGRAWVDDSQIAELHVTRHDDKHRPRVEVAITASTQEQP